MLIFRVAHRVTVRGFRIIQSVTDAVAVGRIHGIGHIADDVTVGGCRHVVGVTQAVAVWRVELAGRADAVTVDTSLFAGLTHAITSGIARRRIHRTAGLAGISRTIAVRVELVGVGNERAVVDAVRHAIVIGIVVIRVGSLLLFRSVAEAVAVWVA